uniref:ORM1-like protein 3 n=2 Tax=Odontella aurita TaxID=265563 RepID=A0A7S4JZS7_9STRA|mmetsp:Transcript_57867/g.172747  ORF Transcript_57867/g.172747 Transcript_57867/m.172747 type:complete len:242 (+) Transcript_57867:44-769(+)
MAPPSTVSTSFEGGNPGPGSGGSPGSTSSHQSRPRTDSSPTPPPRSRHGSSDIPRTYSGLYGQGGPNSTDQSGNVTPDLLPFELSRNRNTDWIDTGTPFLLVTYLLLVFAGEAAMCAIVPFRTSWTVSNVVHGLVTYVYLHWIKGSPNFYEQGEMNAMTFWEQLSSSPEKIRENQKRFLMVIPTVLCHAACHFARYERRLCAINVAVWLLCVVAKLDCMSGVRIMGINSTTGIDDDSRKMQ